MLIPLSSIGSVYPAPRHTEMQVCRSMSGGRRRYTGNVKWLLPPMGVRGAMGEG